MIMPKFSHETIGYILLSPEIGGTVRGKLGHYDLTPLTCCCQEVNKLLKHHLEIIRVNKVAFFPESTVRSDNT